MVRKLQKKHENPIDNIIYIIVEKLDPILYKLNLTPNIITTFSLITGILSAYYLYNKNYLCIPLYIISYILDCSDGYFARKYNMVTVIGDYFDHISDISTVLLVMYILCVKFKNKYYNILQIFILLLIITIIAVFYHMSLQELIYNKNESSTLNILNNYFDLNIYNIIYSRYFGSGTFNLLLVIIMYYTIHQKLLQ